MDSIQLLVDSGGLDNVRLIILHFRRTA